MPIPKDYLPLVTRLAAKTEEGQVRWRQTRYGGFSVSVGGTDFEVWAGHDEETDRDFVSFSLVDPNTPMRSTLDNWSVDMGDDGYEMMHAFYANARRQALGIPSRLLELERALESSEMVGEEKKKVGKFDDLDESPR